MRWLKEKARQAKHRARRTVDRVRLWKTSQVRGGDKVQVAEAFWREKRNSDHNYAEALYASWPQYLGDDLKKVRRILEFGAGHGQNLAFLNSVIPDAQLRGVDINKVVQEPESALSNYRGIVGNQTALRELADSSSDVAFTMSVLDHIPSRSIVQQVMTALLRIAPHVFLFEPYVEGVEGDVSGWSRHRLKPDLPDSHKVFAPHSYLWDYPTLAQQIGARVLHTHTPLHASSLGPFYHIFYLTTFPR